MKGQHMKFDEFGIIMLAGVFFIGIVLIAFNTPTELLPKVSPLSVNLNLAPGVSETFDLNISGKASGINVTATGELGPWMRFSATDIGVVSGTTKVIQVTVTVPEGVSTGTRRGTIIVFSKEGQVEVSVVATISAVTRLTSRSLSMGDFKVAYLSGTRVLDSSGDTSVAKSYFSEKPLGLVGIIEDEEMPVLTGARVRFIVEDANNLGPIIVFQNGQEIFRENVGPGEVIVPMNMSDIGRSNTIKIKAENPGWFFWAENSYKMRDVTMDISVEGSLPRTFNFTLGEDEYRRFDHAQLTYTVKSASEQLAPLTIEINDQIVYQSNPPKLAFNQNFARSMLGEPLRVGADNTISFNFDRAAAYEIQNAVLTIFTRAPG